MEKQKTNEKTDKQGMTSEEVKLILVLIAGAVGVVLLILAILLRL